MCGKPSGLTHNRNIENGKRKNKILEEGGFGDTPDNGQADVDFCPKRI